MMSHRAGFTMVEMVMALVIFGIALAVATPSLLDLMARFRLKGAARQVMGDLMWVRMQAVSEQNRFKVFVLGDYQYRILDDDNNNGQVDGSEWSGVRDIRDQYPGVTMRFTANPIFYPRGSAWPGTITLTNTSGSKQIKIHITGRVKIA
jgi:type IV fimbrial biogenesis protein FimT